MAGFSALPDETQAEPSKLWGRHQRMWRGIPVGGDLVQFWCINARWSIGSVLLCELLRPRNRLNYSTCYRSNCSKLWKLSHRCGDCFVYDLSQPDLSFWRLQPSLIVMNLCLNASRKAINDVRNMLRGCIFPSLASWASETGEQSACVFEALQRDA